MDPVTLVFYGVICGGLATTAPVLSRPVMRFATGVGVGVGAALLLPFLRSASGY